MEEMFSNIIKCIRVKNRPTAVPYNYRILYKVTQLLLIISYCCTTRKGCSIEKMHMISNTINDKDELNNLLSFIEEKNNNLIIVRFDPVINRAVGYALAENLILRQANGLFKLSPKGKTWVSEINKDVNLFIREKKIMESISFKLTEEKIKSLILDWRINNVEN
ncbi:hypothetical protein FDA33_07160 [Clostridium botulinum]|nr:hypothetical protein [Clostridium botulinum]NFI19446.1 hypothetical protein [Clostridium botulinum]NFL92711.1 hypothetical protein [Clostridium botulinum]NFN51066.1 hypothetical protein [Clostridium botulinum]NFN95144.1 hypothetical protein [Clostridium botulinum]